MNNSWSNATSSSLTWSAALTRGLTFWLTGCQIVLSTIRKYSSKQSQMCKAKKICQFSNNCLFLPMFAKDIYLWRLSDLTHNIILLYSLNDTKFKTWKKNLCRNIRIKKVPEKISHLKCTTVNGCFPSHSLLSLSQLGPAVHQKFSLAVWKFSLAYRPRTTLTRTCQWKVQWK